MLPVSNATVPNAPARWRVPVNAEMSGQQTHETRTGATDSEPTSCHDRAVRCRPRGLRPTTAVSGRLPAAVSVAWASGLLMPSWRLSAAVRAAVRTPRRASSAIIPTCASPRFSSSLPPSSLPSLPGEPGRKWSGTALATIRPTTRPGIRSTPTPLRLVRPFPRRSAISAPPLRLPMAPPCTRPCACRRPFGAATPQIDPPVFPRRLSFLNCKGHALQF